MADQEEKLALLLLTCESPEKTQICPVCNNSFENIQRHARIHGTAFLRYLELARQKIVDDEKAKVEQMSDSSVS